MLLIFFGILVIFFFIVFGLAFIQILYGQNPSGLIAQYICCVISVASYSVMIVIASVVAHVLGMSLPYKIVFWGIF